MAEALWILVANCSSLEEARRIGAALISEGLAKSVNISASMETLYLWEGALVENQERQLIVKLAERRRDAAAARIKALHSFEVPAIVAWRAAYVTADYAAHQFGEG